MKNHPDPLADIDNIDIRIVDILTVQKHPAFHTRSWIKSFIRFSERSRVDFPHPDGPIRAVIRFVGMFIEMDSTARNFP